MRHPEDSLAGYVDGTIPTRERAEIDAHLAGCARCRQEVTLGAGARAALASLPEVAPPPGIAGPALDLALAGRPRRRLDRVPRWYRLAGAAAAAAAVLVVVALVLPNLGQDRGPAADAKRNALEEGRAAAAATPLDATQIEIERTNYDRASLTALAASYAAQGEAGQAAVQAPAATTPFTPGTREQAQRALGCIARSAPDETGQLVRLIQARFQGAQAILAVFLEGPGADQPPDAVSIWVFATKGCGILSYSSARL